MAYVALAAAAFAQPSDVFTLSLWAVSLLAFCYAVTAAVVAQDRLRTVATGFAVTAAVVMACLHEFPARAPWYLWFVGKMSKPGMESVERLQRSILTITPSLADPNYPKFMDVRLKDYGHALQIQAANAVVTMAAGLIGCGLGALAYRRGQSTSD